MVEMFHAPLSDSFVPILQFEPERFVEGLLGIGAAGGGSSKSKSNEGAILAARLAEMRKQRDARAKVVEKVAAQAPVAVAATPEPVLANNNPPPTGAQKPNRPANKKKKKKGKK
jgi:hypothetical protein